MLYYNPRDKHSSPMTAHMGNIVIYRDYRRGGQIEEFPAIVVKTYDGSDRLDLMVFSTYGTRHIMRVLFSTEQTEENSWHWPTEPTAKPMQLSEAPADAKPVDSPVPVAQDGG